jgi:phosphoserine phosphatase
MERSSIKAIDVLLETDARMLAAAEKNNARLRKVSPSCFSLDAEHRPHITLLQCFVASEHLDAFSRAVGEVVMSADVTRMPLQAVRYGYTPGPGMGVAGIWVAVTPALLKLQADVIAAAAPFMVETAGIEAFTADHGNPAFDKALVDYVSGFCAHAAGAKFDPHVSTGIAATGYLDGMVAEPFEPFGFTPAGAAIYQLGPFGTAARRLKRWGEAGTAGDPTLSGWRDGAAKRAILDFVARVSTVGHPDFVPPSERIAVFDNDGTLWAEHPLPVQARFVLDRIRALAPQNPEWNHQRPFKDVLEGNVAGVMSAGMDGLTELVMATHAGMSTEAFAELVRDWIAAARDPRFGRPHTHLVYRPMLDVLALLREKGFKTFIVSGGGIEFMRTFSDEVYGIPPEQVIGTSIVTRYVVDGGAPALLREARLHFFDDKEGKPVAINAHIGRRPIAAFGNSDGDFAMLEWVTTGPGPRFGLLIHHDDAQRESAYDRDAGLARLARGLDEGPARGWTIASIKSDWDLVFPD